MSSDLDLSCVLGVEFQGLVSFPVRTAWLQHGLQLLVVTGQLQRHKQQRRWLIAAGLVLSSAAHGGFGCADGNACGAAPRPRRRLVHFKYSHHFHENYFCCHRCDITVCVMEQWQPHASSVFRATRQRGSRCRRFAAKRSSVQFPCAEFACSGCAYVLVTAGTLASSHTFSTLKLFIESNSVRGASAELHLGLKP